jgi:hypothetical protein
MPHNGLPDEELINQIREMKKKGYARENNSRLFALSFERDKRLSDQELISLIEKRLEENKPVDTLLLIAKIRRISV